MHCLPIAELVIVVVVARLFASFVVAVAVVGRKPAVLCLRWPADNAATKLTAKSQVVCVCLCVCVTYVALMQANMFARSRAEIFLGIFQICFFNYIELNYLFSG